MVYHKFFNTLWIGAYLASFINIKGLVNGPRTNSRSSFFVFSAKANRSDFLGIHNADNISPLEINAVIL